MNLPENAHVAVLDGARFVLLRNCGTSAEPILESEGQPEVDETDGASSAGLAGTSTIERLDKFAHAAGAAEWLNRAVLSHRVERLLVIADPDTLDEMRHHYHRDTRSALVGELYRQMVGVHEAQIAEAIRIA